MNSAIDGMSLLTRRLGTGSVFGCNYSLFSYFSSPVLVVGIYFFSFAALNSLITFSYTTNVREAAGRFFSRFDVMPL